MEAGTSQHLTQCPVCDGASNAARNSAAAVTALIAREHAKIDRIRAAHGLPLAGDARTTEPATRHAPPPEGFSKADGKVPLLGAEQAVDARRRQIQANVAAVAKKLKGGGR